jgi:glycogen debranching enzyme
MAATDAALDHLWSDRLGLYCSRDARTGRHLEMATVAALLPLWAGTGSAEHTAALLARLRAPSDFHPRFPVPSVPTGAPEFDANRYWSGPTWVNTNWMIIQALRRLDEPDLAAELTATTLALVDEAGCFEYFSALTGAGFGAPDFSWTAALVLDLLAAP